MPMSQLVWYSWISNLINAVIGIDGCGQTERSKTSDYYWSHLRKRGNGNHHTTVREMNHLNGNRQGKRC